MRLIPILFLASCVGVPDRATVSVGAGDGEIDGIKADFPTSSQWVELGLEFPLGVQRQPCRPVYEEPLPEPPAQVAEEPPWWEDFNLVQTLVILLAGGAMAEARRPAQRWIQSKKDK